MTRTLTSPTTATTRALGAALAAHVRAGDVLVLAGDLGAGKTALVQGLAAGLGYDGRVTSPTFLLARTLPTEPPLVHADAWRLDHVGDVFDLGDEVLDEDVVTVLEWGDAVSQVLPADRLEIRLSLASGVDDLTSGGAADGGAADGDLPRTVEVAGLGTWASRALAADGDLVSAVDVVAVTEDA